MVVTGTSSGIGRATVLAFAEAGWDVVATVRDDSHAERFAGVGGVEVMNCDITDDERVGAFAAAVTAGGPVDALVGNAGTTYPGPFELVAAADLRWQFDVNVVGHLELTRRLLPALRRSEGRVILVSSGAGRLPLPYMGAYSASKHALEAAADALRVELAPWNVRVVLVEPGNVATDYWSTGGTRVDLDDPDGLYGRQLADLEAMFARPKRLQRPEKVAGVILRAAGAARPRTRYPVGADAWTAAIAGRLPDRLRDAMWRRRYQR